MRISSLLVGAALLAVFQGGFADTVNEPAAGRVDQKIPFKQSEDSTASLVLRIAGGLVVTVLIGIGVLYAIKRFLPIVYRPTSSGHARIQVLEIRPLTPKTTLFLVELENTRLLLAQSGDGIALLHQCPAAQRVSSDDGRQI